MREKRSANVEKDSYLAGMSGFLLVSSIFIVSMIGQFAANWRIWEPTVEGVKDQWKWHVTIVLITLPFTGPPMLVVSAALVAFGGMASHKLRSRFADSILLIGSAVAGYSIYHIGFILVTTLLE